MEKNSGNLRNWKWIFLEVEDDNCHHRGIVVPKEWTGDYISQLITDRVAGNLREPIEISTIGEDRAFGICPTCGMDIPKFTLNVEPTRFCGNCGQAINWKEEEEENERKDESPRD